MIIISNKNIENSVYFPQNIYTLNTDIYILRLFDRASNVEYNFKHLEDKHLVQYGFYTFFLNFKNVPKGEYEYLINDSESKTVGKGLIRLNELENEYSLYKSNYEYVIYDKQ